MQIHGVSHLHSPQPLNAPHRAAASQPMQPQERLTGADELDISHEAEWISRINDLPEVRQDRVDQIRAAIESGEYETDEKLDIAVGRLFDELVG